MFLKALQRRKSGKKHTYWALVESVRTAHGSRHRVVAYLGELTRSKQDGWSQLGRRLDGKRRPCRSLFDPPHYDDPAEDEPALVHLKDVRLERLRDFGDVWLALGLWRLLGLDTLLAELMPAGREDVSWPVVTEDGMPLGYEVFAGNTHDSRTVEEIVRAMEGKYGRARRVWVMDRGMVSEDNLAFIRARDGYYIVGTPKQMLRSFEQHLTEGDWHEVRAGVEVKLVPGPQGDETFILARSLDRRQKEQAMHECFVLRMEKGLEKLRQAADAGRLTDLGLARERLGRLKERHWRASGAFDVRMAVLAAPQGKSRLSITWTRNERWREWSALSEGCCLLRTNLTETDPATLWKRYIQLTEAEWAFRIMKDELVIRPIWHRKEDRVLAHILVCFLAYVLWKTLAQWMRRSGLGDAPPTLVEEFAKIKSGDVVLPAVSDDGARRTIRLRCVTSPDAAQKVLLNRLGLKLPQRLRRIDQLVKM